MIKALKIFWMKLHMQLFLDLIFDHKSVLYFKCFKD